MFMGGLLLFFAAQQQFPLDEWITKIVEKLKGDNAMASRSLAIRTALANQQGNRSAGHRAMALSAFPGQGGPGDSPLAGVFE